MTLSKILSDFRGKFPCLLEPVENDVTDVVEQYLQSSLEQFAGYLMEGVRLQTIVCDCGYECICDGTVSGFNNARLLLKQRIEEAGIVIDEKKLV